jgi:hypothetical protein
MIGQFSKPHLGILAALLVAATLPVRAEDSAKGSGGTCLTAAGLNALRPAMEARFPFSSGRFTGPGLVEGPAFLVLPQYGVLPLESRAGFETDQGAGHNTFASGGRMLHLLHHITWSWAPPPPDADPVQYSAMLNRP